MDEHRRDGNSYFGLFQGENDGEVDYPLVLPKSAMGNLQVDENNLAGSIQLFLIKYEPETNIFVLKDLYSGMAPFIKVEQQTPIKNNSLLQVGESYLLFSNGECSDEVVHTNENRKENSLSVSQSNMVNIKAFDANSQLIADPM